MEFSNHRLEARVADLFGYSNAVLFGRARSGVVALLSVLGLGPEAPFVMPSNLCSSLLLAVRSSGAKVELAGVSELNGLASDMTLVATMKQCAVPGVIMPAHLYGFVQPYEQTLSYAKAHNWFVLENDTIATKARFGGASRSAFGDALLVSFGYAKTIEAGGGGALLTDDVALARELRLRAYSFPLWMTYHSGPKLNSCCSSASCATLQFRKTGYPCKIGKKFCMSGCPNASSAFRRICWNRLPQRSIHFLISLTRNAVKSQCGIVL